MNTKTIRTSVILIVIGALLSAIWIPGQAQTSNPDAALESAFTYQGRLRDGGAPAEGSYDLRCLLYDAAVGGAQVGGLLAMEDVPVTDGYFTVSLDFGAAAFRGQARWLEIAVRPGGSTGEYTILAPRQALTTAPYALYAPAAGSVPWSGLTGVPVGFADGVDNDTTYSAGSGLSLSETQFSVDTAAIQARVNYSCTSGYSIRVINPDGSVECERDTDTTTFWGLSGSSGTNVSVNYLGTSDNQPLELRVNGQRALRLEPTGGTPNLVGGYSGNSATPGIRGAVIAGGGTASDLNLITDDFGTVGGGISNQAGDAIGEVVDASFATVGGGYLNTASGYASMIGGGHDNAANLGNSTVGGGAYNLASGNAATVGGGYSNAASGLDATIAGGGNNTASNTYATIGGGSSNSASASLSTVAGGTNNLASGDYATIGGGYFNSASASTSTVGGGNHNTSAGGRAVVGGGYYNTASGSSSTVPGGNNNLAAGDYSFAAGRHAKANHEGAFVWADNHAYDFASPWSNSFSARATGGFQLVAGIDGTGTATWTCSFLDGTSWSCTSDRDQKENFQDIDRQALLETLSHLPLQTWNAKGADPNVKHLGPMAQDFHAAFGLGDDDKSISTIDLDGVSLAAIQGLYQLNQDQQAEIEALQARLDALESTPPEVQPQGQPPASGQPVIWMAGLLVAGWLVGRRNPPLKAV